jgi:hypothetical protein
MGERPSPLQLARELFNRFQQLLPREMGDGIGGFNELPAQAQEAFIEAVEDVVCKRIDDLLWEIDMATALEGALSDKPKAKEEAKEEPTGTQVKCYYCGKHWAVKWYACHMCLRGAR